MSRRDARFKICHFAIMIVLFGSLFSTIALASDGDAGYPGAFLRHGGSVRSQALGEAGVTLDGGPNSMFYNPANLMRTETALGISFMHFSNPLVDGYNSVALSMNRMYKGDSELLKYLFGSNSSWGIMFLDLGIDDIVQRTSENQLINGNLSYFDQAFLMAFAHETVGSQGVLGYGMNLKFVGQGFSGAGEYANSTWGFGMDVGLNYQPINPTLIKKIASLKFLLPLRLGLNIQNLISPEMGVLDSPDDGDAARVEKLPTMVRTGFSYNLYNLLGEDTKLLLVGDLDWMMETGEYNGSRGMGTYLGCEGQIKAGPVALEPRVGFNSVGGESKFAAGFGVKYPVKSLMLQFDFSQGFNEYLDDERRVAFSIGLLGDRGADYFHRTDYVNSDKAKEFQKLSHYSPQRQVAAAKILADTQDPLNKDRYGHYIGGRYLAHVLYEEMLAEFLKNDFSAGISTSSGVVSAYEEFFDKSPDKMESRDRVEYGEAVLVGAGNEGSKLSGNIEAVLQSNGPDLTSLNSERLYYLGVNNLLRKNYQLAVTNFDTAIRGKFVQLRSLDLLAKFGHAQALLGARNVDKAKTILLELKAIADSKGGHLMLDKDYPRVHPEPEIGKSNPFNDRDLADNVLFALGRCYGSGKDARLMYANIVRFYPQSDLADAARLRVANPASGGGR